MIGKPKVIEKWAHSHCVCADFNPETRRSQTCACTRWPEFAGSTAFSAHR